MAKAVPCTAKASSTPKAPAAVPQMNQSLVAGNAQTHKGFVDIATSFGKGFDEAMARNPKSKEKKEEAGLSLKGSEKK